MNRARIKVIARIKTGIELFTLIDFKDIGKLSKEVKMNAVRTLYMKESSFKGFLIMRHLHLNMTQRYGVKVKASYQHFDML